MDDKYKDKTVNHNVITRTNNLMNEVNELVLDKNLKQAIVIQEQLLQYMNEYYGPRHLFTLSTMIYLAQLIYQENSLNSYFSEGLYNQVISLCHDDDTDRQDTNIQKILMKSMIELAILSEKQSNYTESLSLYQKALEISREIYNNDNENIADIYIHISMILINQQEYSIAKYRCEQALNILINNKGIDHDTTKATIALLINICKKHSKYLQSEGLICESIVVNRQIYNNSNVLRNAIVSGYVIINDRKAYITIYPSINNSAYHIVWSYDSVSTSNETNIISKSYNSIRYLFSRGTITGSLLNYFQLSDVYSLIVKNLNSKPISIISDNVNTNDRLVNNNYNIELTGELSIVDIEYMDNYTSNDIQSHLLKSHDQIVAHITIILDDNEACSNWNDIISSCQSDI